MLTFLRCGVYRLVHGRKFWIGTALASVLCFAVMALMFVTMGMVDVDGTVSTGTVHLTVGGERYAGVEMDADDAALLGMFADRTVPNHSFLLVFMGFFQGGMAGLLVSIIATLAYAEDHEHGFVKAELAGRAGRIGYYASHLVLAALLAAWYSLVVIASTELAFAVFGIRVADPEPFGQYWRLAGLNILGVVAVTFIVTALHTIVRSKVAGVIIAVFVASGAVSSLATSCAQLLGSRLDWIPHVVAWLPMVNLGLLDDSAPAVGLTSSATQGAFGLPDAGMPVWAHALVCFIGWIALAAAVTLLANRRHDVC